jgi:hypothetical protein
MIEDVLKRIDELIECAEFHYYHPDKEMYMDGYIDGLKTARQEIEKKFLPK